MQSELWGVGWLDVPLVHSYPEISTAEPALKQTMAALSSVTTQQMVIGDQLEHLVAWPFSLAANYWPEAGYLGALITAFSETPAQGILLTRLGQKNPPLSLLPRLAHGNRRAVIAQGPVVSEPLLAYYHRSCLAPAQNMLKQGKKEIDEFLRLVHAEILPCS